MLSRLNEYQSYNPSTNPEWMAHATTVFPLKLLNLLLPPEQHLLSVQLEDRERSRYILSSKAGSFLDIVCSFIVESLPLIFLTVPLVQALHLRTRMG